MSEATAEDTLEARLATWRHVAYVLGNAARDVMIAEAANLSDESRECKWRHLADQIAWWQEMKDE
jgi:hypothetical protein